MKLRANFIDALKESGLDYFNLSYNLNANLKWWHLLELEEEDYEKAISVALIFRPETYGNGSIANEYIRYKKLYCGKEPSELPYGMPGDLDPDNFIDCLFDKLAKRKRSATRVRIREEIDYAFKDSSINSLDVFQEIVDAYLDYFQAERDMQSLPQRLKEVKEKVNSINAFINNGREYESVRQVLNN